MIDKNEIAASFILRSDLYSFFDIVFRREPDAETFVKLTAILPRLRIYAENFGDKSFQRDTEILSDYFLKDSADSLATDFSRMFYGVDKHNSVYPYESVYLSAERIMMQKPRDEVTEFYAKNGFGIKKDVKEFEDHVSVEFCFMSHMHSMIAAAAGNNDAADTLKYANTALCFLNEHPSRWVQLLYNDMKNIECSPFYLAACGMASYFVEEDNTFLENFCDILTDS